MNRLRRAVKRYPTRATFVLAGLLFLTAASGTFLYVIAAQPNPTVRMLPMSWQKVAAPVLNTGVDAKGLTLDQFAAQGGNPVDWRPVETSTVVAGGMAYILRFQEFRNKMAEPTVSRVLLCGKVTLGTSPTVDVSGLTPFDLGTIPAPTRTDGAAVKNHPTRIPDYVMKDASGAWLTQPRTCLYRASAKFIKNPSQSVEIQFEPVALTVVAPAKP